MFKHAIMHPDSQETAPRVQEVLSAGKNRNLIILRFRYTSLMLLNFEPTKRKVLAKSTTKCDLGGLQTHLFDIKCHLRVDPKSQFLFFYYSPQYLQVVEIENEAALIPRSAYKFFLKTQHHPRRMLSVSCSFYPNYLDEADLVSLFFVRVAAKLCCLRYNGEKGEMEQVGLRLSAREYGKGCMLYHQNGVLFVDGEEHGLRKLAL